MPVALGAFISSLNFARGTPNGSSSSLPPPELSASVREMGTSSKLSGFDDSMTDECWSWKFVRENKDSGTAISDY
jgi:hypothetical protein